MDRKQQIYAALKPKVKSFGFTKKELMSVAGLIDDNLTLSDDAKDEDVTNAIDEQIEAVVPFLKFGQSFASRIIDANKSQSKPKDGDGDGDGTTPPAEPNPKPKDGDGDSETLKLFKSLSEKFENVQKELSDIKAGKTTETRRSKVQAKVKDLGEYGKQLLKNFDRMSFKDEEDFDDYVTDMEEGIKAYNKERTDKGLAALGASAAGHQETNHKKELSDAEIDKLVDGIN